MYSNKQNITAPVLNVTNPAARPQRTRQPFVRIVEEPRSHGLRFRYQCEGRRSGSIVGENWSTLKKTSPTIEIVNSQGPFFVVVSCVTKEPPYHPHPHHIVGRGKEFSKGIFYRKVPAGDNIVEFPGMTIECVKKNKIAEALEERKRMKVDPFMTGSPDDSKSIDLSCVRLCFQVFLEGSQEGNFNVVLKPVVSQPIYDKKSSFDFEIKWMSYHSASVAGGKVICFLGDKLVKDDIEVIFFCERTGWRAKADFAWPFSHKQVAVVVKSPPYFVQEVTEPVQVQVMLRKPSNGATSTPRSFQLLPVEVTSRDLRSAKRHRLSVSPRTLVEKHTLTENHQPSSQLLTNLGAPRNGRTSQKQQHSVLPNQQNLNIENRNAPSIYQVPPFAPTAEFDQYWSTNCTNTNHR